MCWRKGIQLNRKQDKRNIMAVLAAAFMSFVGILTETSLNVTFPTMMKQFNVSLDVVQWTTTGYLLMIAIIMICSSYLNERFTAKQLFIVSCSGFIVGSLISAFAGEFYVLLFGRLISSLGAGLSIPLMFNLIVEVMPQKKWGLYMGIAGLIIAMAPTLGPAFGGAITYYFNWRDIFFIVAIFAAIVFCAGVRVIGKYHEQTQRKFDYLGFVLLATAFITLTLGVNQISRGFKNIFLWLLLVGSLLLFYLYKKWAQNNKESLLNIVVFRQTAFVYGALAYFLLQFANIGVSFVLPNYIQIVGHQNALIGGLVLLPGSIIAGLLNPIFGSLYDRLGAKPLLYTGGSILALSGLLFAIYGLTLTTLMIMVFYGLLAFGHRMSFSNTLAEALKIEPNNLHTDATAVCQTAQQLAGSIGTTIMAAIIAIFQNESNSSYAIRTARGSQAAFYFIFGLGILILILDWAMFRLERKNSVKN